jgi:2'-5' RNA ligase
MPRLFVAIWPTEEVVRHVRALPRDSWRDVRWTPEENWHITLRFLGEELIESAIEVLTGVGLPASTAEVSSQIVHMGARSLIVPVAGVDALAGAVREATQGLGTDALDPRFRGHITVGRSVGQKPIKGGPVGSHHDVPLAFDVHQVSLVTSVLTNHGAIYDSVATFDTSSDDGTSGVTPSGGGR